ncbi:hypothetical protein HPB48_013784 [Haemaphysalis longicornis]|uniref:Uncharacterized protein n=1 Tax=Haemaphysalis longicornis TaxID=44386 RepID=A0A9J6GYZ7_HAELO|nr:hypothetical protein HPB48_013784 [Haemaphysalis longicornis]
MSEEGKMDDGLEFSRAQVEESRTARVIRKCGSLFKQVHRVSRTLPECRLCEGAFLHSLNVFFTV